MPAPVNRKCRSCAFNPIELAKEQSCWNSKRCQPKRSYYRKRESGHCRLRIVDFRFTPT